MEVAGRESAFHFASFRNVNIKLYPPGDTAGWREERESGSGVVGGKGGEKEGGGSAWRVGFYKVPFT